MSETSTSASCQKWSIANSVWGEPDYSVATNNALAIERRGGRGGGGAPMLVGPVGRDQRSWNKGLLIGQKKPLEPKHVWFVRVRLEIARSWRDLVIFNLAIDSKLRACDLVVKLRLDDICSGCGIEQRSFKRRQVDQSSSRSPSSREAPLKPGYQYSGPLAPDISSQVDFTQGPTYPRQYARLVHRWVESIGLESASYGTHSMRRTKAAQIYRKTGNLRAMQLLLSAIRS